LWEFHDIDNFGALGDKDGPNIVLRQRVKGEGDSETNYVKEGTLEIMKVIGSKLTTFPATAYWSMIHHCGSFITKTSGLECMPLFDNHKAASHHHHRHHFL